MSSSLIDLICATTTAPTDFEAVPEIDFEALRNLLATTPDPRSRRGCRYEFAELLSIFVAAVLCGAKSLTMITE
ncbi:transposase family protein, partial [Gulosibacter molinativorax]